MSSLQAKRTLVKSPPELWSELAEVESLNRHLGEFGEIRIKRVEPERVVEWETERAAGVVRLEQTGWGTRVTLTAEELPVADAEPAGGDPEPAEVADPVARPGGPPPATGPAPAEPSGRAPAEPAVLPAGSPAPPAAASPTQPAPPAERAADEALPPPVAASHRAAAPEPAPRRRGWLARLLFARRARRQAAQDAALDRARPAADPDPRPEAADPAAVPVPPASHPVPPAAADPGRPATSTAPAAEPDATGDRPASPSPSADPEATAPVKSEPAPGGETPGPAPDADSEREERDLSDGDWDLEWSFPRRVEHRRAVTQSGLDAERARAVLSAALDRLGAAHHRPFSRS